MSIWSSMDGDHVRALNGHDQAANYRGEGTPTIDIDVATATSYHDRIRVAVWDDDNRIDECVLIDPDGAVRLAAKLLAAVQIVQARRPAPATEVEVEP